MSELIRRDGNAVHVDTDLSMVVEAIADAVAQRRTDALADRVEAVLRDLVQQLEVAFAERVAPIEHLVLQVAAPTPPAEPRVVRKTVIRDVDGGISEIVERTEP